MESGVLVEAIATWAHFAIAIFCVAAVAGFLGIATRRRWAGGSAHLVVGPTAKLVFVLGTFAVIVVVALSVCDLVLGVEAKEPLSRSIGSVSAYVGALVGFHAAARLDSVTQALLPVRGVAKLPPAADGPGLGKGLRRVAPVAGELCWTCGKSKASAEHLAGCPAGKGGAS